jgi:hypothetical protein
MTRTVKADHAAKKNTKIFSLHIIVHSRTCMHCVPLWDRDFNNDCNDVQYINIKNFDFLLLVSTNTINNKEKEIQILTTIVCKKKTQNGTKETS